MGGASPRLDFLARVKRRPKLPLPAEPEELASLLRQVDRPGTAAEIKGAAYFGVLERDRVIVRLPLHYATLRGADIVRLFWIECTTRRAYGCRLAPREVPELARLFGVADLPGSGPTLGGVPAVPVAWLRPGDRFRDALGARGQVAGAQSNPGAVIVWLDPDELSARRVELPRGTLVVRAAGEDSRG